MTTIAFTPGEPAGIGLDLAILYASQTKNNQLLHFSDPDVLLDRAKKLNITINLKEDKQCNKFGDIAIYPVHCVNKVKAGVLDVNNSSFVLSALDKAIKYVQNKAGSALLTGPMHKGIINDYGVRFTGHTEYLANKTKAKTVMMLANDKLRVALVTTHLPLRLVSEHITRDNLSKTINILHNSLKIQFNITKPKIAICGLNPHAGEGGHLGNEEIDVINPTIEQCRQQGMNLSNALSADTLFTTNNLAKYDCILSMFHDQGLPAFKALGFENSVNITLGLPFIRTSVDHGTALPLAGTGNISLGSFQTALNYTQQLIKHQAKYG